MRLVNADALAVKLRHMGYMDEDEEIQEVIDRFAEERDGDLISRQAAIRWVKTECNPYGKPTLEFESGKKVIEHLKQMPSAEPERKTGKWIREVLGSTSGYGTTVMYQCTNCEKMSISKYKFCPNCGSRMLEEGGEDDG